MSLLARIDAALLRRHQRACPWPTTSGAITTRKEGAKMSAYCMDCNVRAVPERGPGTPLVIRHSEDCPTWAPSPLRSDSQPLAADSGTPPTNESPHLAAKYWRERQALRVEVGRLTMERDEAYAHMDSWKAVLATANLHVARLATERDDLRIRLAERDAQVGRLTKRLSEGQG